MQAAIIQKEQHAIDEENEHGYKPKLNKKSTKIAGDIQQLSEKVEYRLGSKTYRNNRFTNKKMSYQ